MHDLVHDLAEIISASKLGNGEIDNHNQVRYLALNSLDGMTKKIVEDLSISIRTLFLRDKSFDMLPKFKNLYVLNLKGADMMELPTSIGKLIHLRFLLTSFWIKTLPESVCKLYCLQTLRVENLNDLPKGFSNLISLRHLYFNHEDIQMPLGMGRLTCLQTVEFFNVGEEKGRQIEELRHLKDLEGKLVIRNLELVNGKEGAKESNLCGKPNLLKLEFKWNSNDREGANYDEDVLEGLQPHSNLQELKISNFLSDKFPQWLINSSTALNKLVDLSLINCKRCREVPGALGQLPFLQNLKFRALPNVKTIGLSFYEITSDQQLVAMPSRKLFPMLNTLHLEEMGNLEEWMEPKGVAVDVFPMLEKLHITGCPQLVNVPSQFPSLQNLKIEQNDHVSVVKRILAKVTNLSDLHILGLTGMAGLMCFTDVTHNLHQINNLRSLTLMRCPDFTSVRGCGTSLESMTIVDCDNLRELTEGLSTHQSLHHLEIQRCPIIINVGQQGLTTMSLNHLSITGCEGLTSIMLGTCPSLTDLSVRDCPNLVSFSMLEQLNESPSLTTLYLMNCPKLLTMPKGFASLTCLWHLSVGPFSDDSLINNEFDWSGLVSSSKLRFFALYGMPHSESLPNQLQYLTSLRGLYLHEFGGIEALPDWIGRLAPLRELSLIDCEKLRYLPSEAAMRRLTELQWLKIFGCPLLKERCSPQSGPNSEWSKVSRIRYLLTIP